MKINGAYERPPFVFWGNKNTSNSVNAEQYEKTQLSSRHVPSLIPFFNGKQLDSAFIHSGGYNFNGNKINFLA